MTFKQWIKGAEANGWRVSKVKGLNVHLQCSKIGCPGCKVVPLNNPGSVPDPCDLPHVGEYSQPAYDSYRLMVEELRRRRAQMGFSQEALNAVIGFTDGHVSKLESHARTASPITLELWAKALGLHITFVPAPLPDATIRAIQELAGNPYQPNQARFKHQLSLPDDR